MNANGKKVNKKKKNRKREKGEKGPPKKTNPVSRKQTKKHVIGQNCVKIMMTKKDMGYRTNYCLLAETQNTLHRQRVNLLVFWPNLIHPLLISLSTSARIWTPWMPNKIPIITRQPWKQINQCDLLYNLPTSITLRPRRY